MLKVEVKENCLLNEFSYFKIGGSAKNIYFPKSEEEMIYLLETLKNPLVFGGMSNVLFSSLGVEQDVIITSKMVDYSINSQEVNALCGVRGAILSRSCVEHSLTGFEFMSGFPGTIGGNIFMNASAHSQSISDALICVKVFDCESKKVLNLVKEDLNFSYRTSILQFKPYILLSAKFHLKSGNRDEMLAKIQENKLFRQKNQPIALPNVGSIFRNPEGNSAGKLLDEIGAKSFKIGGAKVFENHANFIVNVDNASSTDVLELMCLMYDKVLEKFNIELKPEVRFFGIKNEKEIALCKKLFR